MSIKVRGGTPYHGGDGLCHSCKHSHVYRAAAESQVVVICRYADMGGPPMKILKPVVECSEYANKTDKSLYEMEKIAWPMATKGGKQIGFVSPQEARRKAKDGLIDELEDN